MLCTRVSVHVCVCVCVWEGGVGCALACVRQQVLNAGDTLTVGCPKAGVAQTSQCLSVSVCVCMCEPELIPVIINSLIPKTKRVAWFCLFVLSWNIQSHVPVWLQCGIGWTAVGR